LLDFVISAAVNPDELLCRHSNGLRRSTRELFEPSEKRTYLSFF
jgi:hypothetical protein